MTPIAIRRAGPADAAKLALVAQAGFLESFAHDHPGDDLVAYVTETHSVERYRALLADASVALWIVEAPLGAPVGYAMLSGPDILAEPEPGDLELKRIYLLIPWQGEGRGVALFDAVLGEARARGARRLLLAVYESNHRARAFYARQGFRPVGTAEFWVGDTRFDDIVLALDL